MSSGAIELDYFTLFMTTELTEIIVVETNRYAAEIRAKVSDDKPHARIRSWKEVNSDSIWHMIASTIAMEITKKPTTNSYWSTKAVWQTKFFASVMGRSRYKVILQSLHFQNNQLNKPEGDCIWKLRPLYEMLTAKFTSVYAPEQDISIDESLLLYKGRLFFKQYGTHQTNDHDSESNPMNCVNHAVDIHGNTHCIPATMEHSLTACMGLATAL